LPKYTAEFYAEVTAWVVEAKIKSLEHRYEGLENAEQALLDVQTGGNFGKAVIIVASE
jgi:NADPH-dependent curcumin reductase CurA